MEGPDDRFGVVSLRFTRATLPAVAIMPSRREKVPRWAGEGAARWRRPVDSPHLASILTFVPLAIGLAQRRRLLDDLVQLGGGKKDNATDPEPAHQNNDARK